MSAKRKFLDLLLNSSAFCSLKHGTRQPTSFPVWATLEVGWGGFSTGKALSVLNGSEKTSFDYLRFESDAVKLKEMLATGQYVTDYPENTALLVVTWLVENDRAEEALKIVEEIGPYLNALRFYPRPLKRLPAEPTTMSQPIPRCGQELKDTTLPLTPTLLDGPKVSLQTAADALQNLKKVIGAEENLAIVRVWKRKVQQSHFEEYCPLEMKILDLVLETYELPAIVRKKLQEAQEQGKNPSNLLEGLMCLDEKGMPLKICPWPFQQFPADRERWDNAVRAAAVEYTVAAKGKDVTNPTVTHGSGRRSPVVGSRRKPRKADWKSRRGTNQHRFGADSSLLPIVEALQVIVTKGEKALTGKQVAEVRCHVAQVVAKRGLPGSDRRQEYLRRVKESVPPNNIPLIEVLYNRLNRLAFEEGYLADGLPPPALAKCLEPIREGETTQTALVGKPLPETLRRILERCKLGSLADLAQSKLLVPSAEVLASLSNKAFPLLHGEVIPDPVIRRLYHDTSSAFTRRRSLLLVNLESQARLAELPWIAPLSAVVAAHSAELRQLCLNELYRQVCAYFARFPTIQTPNKFVSAIESLFNPIAEESKPDEAKDGKAAATKVIRAGEARRRVGLTEELAADIFCNCFAKSFEDSLKIAAPRMKNTLYSAYYELDTFYTSFEADLAKPVPDTKPPPTKRSPGEGDEAAHEGRESQRFTDLALQVKMQWMERASQEHQQGKVKRTAENARIIEAAQILLTHNLIQLTEAARLAPMFDHATFQGVLRNAASKSFREIVDLYRPRQESTRQYYERRRALATAQRQYVFFLSQLGPVDQCQVLEESAKLALQSKKSKKGDVKEEGEYPAIGAVKGETAVSAFTVYQLFLEPLIAILHDKGTFRQIGNNYLEALGKQNTAASITSASSSSLPRTPSAGHQHCADVRKPLILKWYPLWELSKSAEQGKRVKDKDQDKDDAEEGEDVEEEDD